MTAPSKAIFAATQHMAELIRDRNGLDRTQWDAIGFSQALAGRRFDFILVADVHPHDRLTDDKLSHLRTRLGYGGELIII